MYGKYLTMDQFDGSLGGRMPLPAGPYDVSSPGGMSTIQHHWTRGMFGIPERTYDVYAGTGDRYISGVYGNLYQPNAHSYVNDFYYGPDTQKTEYSTLEGDPYFWNNGRGQQKKTSIIESNIKQKFINKLATNSSYYNQSQPISTQPILAMETRPGLPHNPPRQTPLDSNIENFIPNENADTSGDFDLIGSPEGNIPQNNTSEESRNNGPLSLYDPQNTTSLPLPKGRAMQAIADHEGNGMSLSTHERNITPHLRKYLAQQGVKKRSTPIGSPPKLIEKSEPIEVADLPEYVEPKKSNKFVYVIIIVAILIISTVAIELWANSAMKYLHNIHGKDISLPRLLLYAITVTAFLIVFMHILGIDAKDINEYV
jgi:hypothetical protein